MCNTSVQTQRRQFSLSITNIWYVRKPGSNCLDYWNVVCTGVNWVSFSCLQLVPNEGTYLLNTSPHLGLLAWIPLSFMITFHFVFYFKFLNWPGSYIKTLTPCRSLRCQSDTPGHSKISQTLKWALTLPTLKTHL